MGEVRCSLDWTGNHPRLIIDLAGGLNESQVRALARGLGRKAQEMLNCLLSCGGVCPKEEEDGSGNSPAVH